MKIFAEKERPDVGPAQHAEPQYSYLDRSGRVEANHVRSTIEQWFNRCPSSHQQRAIKEMRLNRDENFLGAWFEILLHELFLRNGAELHFEPPVGQGQTKPDFNILLADGRGFVLEATTAIENASDLGSERNLGQLLAAIDAIPHPDLMAMVDFHNPPRSSLPIGRITKAVSRWICALRAIDVRAAWMAGSYDHLTLTVCEEDWQMVLTPYAPQKKKGKRFIASHSGQAHWSTAAKLLAGKLKRKAQHYGRMNRPLVIAVNVIGPGASTDTLVDALFGQLAARFPHDRNDPTPPETLRMPTGLWGTGEEPKFTRLSGVLWSWHLDPWNVGRRRLQWVPNPWAEYSLADVGVELPKCVLQEGGFKETDGEALDSLLGLWPGWPELPSSQ